MSSAFDLVVQLGYDGTSTKYYVIATGTVLFYDHLLTLVDEIKYAWCGKKSWAFWLFVVNRYIPMSYLFWLLSTTYTSHFDMSVCERTAWYSIFMFVICTLLAQVVLTFRIYAVTMKSIPIAIGFAIITVSQFIFGMYVLIRAITEGAQPLPPIPLDAYRLCIFVTHKALEITYTTISLCYDTLAFLVIVFFATKTKARGLRLPTVLGTIAEDAMWYFLVIFTSHFVFAMTVILGRDSIKLLPGPGLIVFLPVMISRLMLSLKKAADSQQRPSWSLAEPSLTYTNIQSARFFSTQIGLQRREDDVPLDTYSEA